MKMNIEFNTAETVWFEKFMDAFIGKFSKENKTVSDRVQDATYEYSVFSGIKISTSVNEKFVIDTLQLFTHMATMLNIAVEQLKEKVITYKNKWIDDNDQEKFINEGYEFSLELRTHPDIILFKSKEELMSKIDLIGPYEVLFIKDIKSDEDLTVEFLTI